jgi:hypothetical protein
VPIARLKLFTTASIVEKKAMPSRATANAAIVVEGGTSARAMSALVAGERVVVTGISAV